jgi:hypothetical protein
MGRDDVKLNKDTGKLTKNGIEVAVEEAVTTMEK